VIRENFGSGSEKARARRLLSLPQYEVVDMKLVAYAITVAMVLGALNVAKAQEPELISEIVAKVNNDIITRSDYLAGVNDFRLELARQLAGKPQAEIDAEFERLKPTVLDLLIENLLLEQKAKELSIDVEEQVNQQMIAIMKENGYKNPQEFEDFLKKQGVDPEAARAGIRKGYQHEIVIQREVIMPVYQNVSDAERKTFFEKNKQKFVEPGGVVLSEIFLSLEGHNATEIEQRARRLVTELRAGGDFADAVAKNTAPNRPSRAKNGKLGSMSPSDLKPEVAAAISSLKEGEVTEPIRVQDGFQIIRVDERKLAIEHTLAEKRVADDCAKGITAERFEVQRKKFTNQLRADAYIFVKPGYPTTVQSNSEKAEVKAAKTKG
jgi:peptidyl-prolyl cis-trans isomerase SurA